MWYLFLQILFWLILALLVGVALGWLLRGVICGPCRDSDEVESTPYAAAPVAAPAVVEETVVETTSSNAITDDMRPVGLDGPDGDPDDLKRISGVGPVIQKTLNGLGIYHFTQISGFSDDNIAWVDNYIDFPGRIKREKWVSQSVELAEGKETEFAQRYDRGEVGENNPNA